MEYRVVQVEALTKLLNRAEEEGICCLGGGTFRSAARWFFRHGVRIEESRTK